MQRGKNDQNFQVAQTHHVANTVSRSARLSHCKKNAKCLEYSTRKWLLEGKHFVLSGGYCHIPGCDTLALANCPRLQQAIRGNKWTVFHWNQLLFVVLLRIPNPRILPESVRVRICGFFCGGLKWLFWVVCLPVNICLSSGGVQTMLHNCVWPPVWLCERLNKHAAADRLTAPPPRCLVRHTCLGTHQRRLSVVTSQLQIIIRSSKSGRVTTTKWNEMKSAMI